MKKTLKELIKEKFNLENKKIDSLAMQGKIFINNEKVFLASIKVDENCNIEIKDKSNKYVSRGAYKLKEAIEKFEIEVENKTCLDIGSSTGGFVQVLLENKANKVYALDSGTNQLDFSLRKNDKVVVYEKTNLKNINESLFDEVIELITCDVSFISLKRVFEVCNKIFLNGTKLMALIKPQFEASSKYVEPGGYVPEQHHEYIKNKILQIAKENNFVLIKPIIKSPILGEKSKNIEYLSFFEKQGE
ncbi:TlyA family RNA methyltransferase [Mycoplasmopsis arginini]|uniref:TlyA family RNA methyltransferase n=1 Tax=Mycoplasmopsis arginini TaxID=2094 RepID=UPI0002D18C3C|nr:TlyA family RNA methyltransferase [Mycoplasmopsis arginini]ENY69699.1 Hemolysin A [Mycoplasmopsis arginini 7264]CRH45817.1 16S/23S rRNA (cytidine-2'-O)-methyltransferase TlyA [Chlamydia trachomatis]CRH46749.1 16S/23S rRNA (cytidine-2'-O)-methyltransferase TlyA [Chlamydia trachomatis]CRH55408.1 16S/23S rRNA (cytidine-2'-O)-methyltransferase TlyA [Chlamydia trachomatis]